MTITLFDATYRAASELGAVTEGVATGGTTTTLVDTRVLALTAADFYNQGMAWILRDSSEGGAAPEGQFGEITDDDGAGTLTVGAVSAGSGNPFTAAPATGDRYAVTTGKYPPHQLISAVNAAIQDIGLIEFTDKTTLDTTASQTEYAIPLISTYGLREIWIQGRTGDSNDNRWFEVKNWDIERVAGSTDLLILPFQYVTGRDIKLRYLAYHNPLDDADDGIDEQIDIPRLAFDAAVRLLEWRANRPGNDPSIEDHLFRLTVHRGADGLTRQERMRAERPIIRPPVRSKLMILGRRVKVDQFTYPGP